MQQSIIETRHMKAKRTEMEHGIGPMEMDKELAWRPPINLREILFRRDIIEDSGEMMFEPFILDDDVAPEAWNAFAHTARV
jgi:hypothetical protein